MSHQHNDCYIMHKHGEGFAFHFESMKLILSLTRQELFQYYIDVIYPYEWLAKYFFFGQSLEHGFSCRALTQVFCVVCGFLCFRTKMCSVKHGHHWRLSKYPAYGRHWISRPMGIVAPIPKRTKMDREFLSFLFAN